MKHADQTLLRYGKDIAYVHFKYTCEKCGTRNVFQEPNVIYERGECVECGHETVIVEGGYTLFLKGKKE